MSAVREAYWAELASWPTMSMKCLNGFASLAPAWTLASANRFHAMRCTLISSNSCFSIVSWPVTGASTVQPVQSLVTTMPYG